VSGVWLVTGFLALPLVAGLDARFGWTRALSLIWHVAGAVVLAVGYGLTVWAMWTNAYFSTAVRIQGERGRDGPCPLRRANDARGVWRGVHGLYEADGEVFPKMGHKKRSHC
jgi:hypothetical protein